MHLPKQLENIYSFHMNTLRKLGIFKENMCKDTKSLGRIPLQVQRF